MASDLNENFEDAKALLLSPMMAINYAHLVMLADRGIVSSGDAHALREALDGIRSERELRGRESPPALSDDGHQLRAPRDAGGPRHRVVRRRARAARSARWHPI